MSQYDWHEQAKQIWGGKASEWNENSEQMWEKGSRKTIIPFLKKHMPENSYIADIGCGDGYGSYKLLNENYRVVGMDISREMIKIASKRSEGDQLTFLQADAAKLPFEENTFDGIMSINCIEWTKKPRETLLEFQRVLRPNAYMCLGLLGPTAHPRQHSFNRLYGENVICNTMMPWEFGRLAVENNWEIFDSHGVYKQGVKEALVQGLTIELKQSLTFMWVFMLKNNKN
ncbi:class I SAM-dependent methyltransferase [Chengkuizengella axinellae]|uniref:Class I SAM-dependent methyltransferase n=1 Tax=Chengkuizengella axinellae TaxID=3064388 RepID=A0ABT9J314_9BACL|nr:class I SAM-dependent methyltransferase [Chengkuizengella sp. 2205SS18-9]MDP5276010.1 class I SAM-dependent methyltransferase [Chengkuizengella sp. 2205SS18-9]